MKYEANKWHLSKEKVPTMTCSGDVDLVEMMMLVKCGEKPIKSQGSTFISR